jgi:hypothetical protein
MESHWALATRTKQHTLQNHSPTTNNGTQQANSKSSNENAFVGGKQKRRGGGGQKAQQTHQQQYHRNAKAVLVSTVDYKPACLAPQRSVVRLSCPLFAAEEHPHHHTEHRGKACGHALDILHGQHDSTTHQTMRIRTYRPFSLPETSDILEQNANVCLMGGWVIEKQKEEIQTVG